MPLPQARHPLLLGLALLPLGACEIPVVMFECTDGEPFCALAEILADEREPASGVDVSRVYLYQGVERPLMENGLQVLTDETPVVAGRAALVRIFVTPSEGFQPRDLTARLYLYRDDKLYTAYQADLTLTGASVETTLGSTFNIEIPNDVLLDGEMGYSVEIVEAPDTPTGTEPAGLQAWPDGLPATLFTTSSAGPLRIMLVPISYDSDGSGRLPDLSEEQVALYESYMRAMYPVNDLEFEIAEEFTTNTKVTAFGGWDTLLYEVMSARGVLGAEQDQYLYGIFQPNDSFGTYCSGGCIMGMSMVSMSAGDAQSRVSIGLGYSGVAMVETMAHEVGHAHGRYHSPGCGAAGPDPAYPESSGHLDLRGYDPSNETLMEASTYFDIMSYCSPYWISDFTWSALFERIRDINLLYGAETSTLTPVRASLPDTNWHSLVLFEDGSLGWAPDTRMAGEPGGTLRRLEILDHQDRVVGAVQARFSPRAPGPGGLLRFNGSFPDLHKVRLDGVDSPPLTP